MAIDFRVMLKEIRRKCLLSQKELGEIAGLDPVSICSYESGARKPSPKSMRKLIDIANKHAKMKLKYDDVNR